MTEIEIKCPKCRVPLSTVKESVMSEDFKYYRAVECPQCKSGSLIGLKEIQDNLAKGVNSVTLLGFKKKTVAKFTVK